MPPGKARVENVIKRDLLGIRRKFLAKGQRLRKTELEGTSRV